MGGVIQLGLSLVLTTETHPCVDITNTLDGPAPGGSCSRENPSGRACVAGGGWRSALPRAWTPATPSHHHTRKCRGAAHLQQIGELDGLVVLACCVAHTIRPPCRQWRAVGWMSWQHRRALL
jgi:hypothetical protein